MSVLQYVNLPNGITIREESRELSMGGRVPQGHFRYVSGIVAVAMETYNSWYKNPKATTKELAKKFKNHARENYKNIRNVFADAPRTEAGLGDWLKADLKNKFKDIMDEFSYFYAHRTIEINSYHNIGYISNYFAYKTRKKWRPSRPAVKIMVNRGFGKGLFNSLWDKYSGARRITASLNFNGGGYSDEFLDNVAKKIETSARNNSALEVIVENQKQLRQVKHHLLSKNLYLQSLFVDTSNSAFKGKLDLSGLKVGSPLLNDVYINKNLETKITLSDAGRGVHNFDWITINTAGGPFPKSKNEQIKQDLDYTVNFVFENDISQDFVVSYHYNLNNLVLPKVKGFAQFKNIKDLNDETFQVDHYSENAEYMEDYYKKLMFDLLKYNFFGISPKPVKSFGYYLKTEGGKKVINGDKFSEFIGGKDDMDNLDEIPWLDYTGLSKHFGAYISVEHNYHGRCCRHRILGKTKNLSKFALRIHGKSQAEIG